jgi:WD40 repeat protein
MSENGPLSAVLAEYLQAVDAGQAPDREQILARHPDLAGELRAFFARQDALFTPAAATPAPTRGLPSPFGPYTLLEEIARGGMGIVYRARQASVNRVVALKMILAGTFASEADLHRFRVEAEAAADLDHPNILPVYEVSEQDGRPYFTMKLAEGGSLERRIGNLPVREAAALLVKLARAVHFAHQRGILHRDLKPANVLLDAHGEPLVADFGLARRVEGDAGGTQTGAIVGTPAYMPPEQARGEKGISTAADVYALGAILYACLTGRPPFRAATAAETIVQVLTAEPVAVRQLNAQVPVDLETICARCLEKDPTKRYASAQELADDLGRYLNGEPIQARPVGAVERAVKWVKRNKGVSALGAAVLLALTAGVGVSSWFAYAANSKAKEAETNLADAKAARKDAERDAAAAKAQSRRAEDARHAILIDQALRAREQGDYNRMEALLGEMRPEYDAAWETGHVRHLWLRHTFPLRTGQEQFSLQGHRSAVRSVAFSGDGKRIASGSSDRTVKVWDAQTGQVTLTLQGHTDGVWSVAFSSDGKRIASGSHDGTVKVWDARTGQEKFTLEGHTRAVTGVAFSGDGKRIVSGGGDFIRPGPGEVKVWDARTGQETPLTLRGHTSSVSSVAFSGDGKRIASGSGDKTVKVWDAGTGQELLTLRGHTSIGVVNSVAFSGDGKRIATGSHDGTVKVWDAGTGQELLTLRGHTDLVCSVAFSGDGKRIASGSHDRTVKVWDAQTGQVALTLRGHTDSVCSVAFSGDGKRIASGSHDGTVKVWDAATGEEALTLKGHTGWVTSVAFSGDGTRIASGGGDFFRGRPGEVKVWDAGTGQELLTLRGHTREVTSVAFSSDGKRIASGSRDETVKVWDASTGPK